MINIHDLEQQRQVIQTNLDQKRTSQERNRLGQFATPLDLAIEVTKQALKFVPAQETIRFLDPAFGTGAFFSALLQTVPVSRIGQAVGYEIDSYYGAPAQELWKSTPLNVHLADFTQTQTPTCEADTFNLILCNPPYVRHHHLKQQKKHLQATIFAATKMKLSGLAGLYCYFMALTHQWLRSEGVAAWLVPSEFMDVNYGQILKKYLLENFSILRIHRFNPNHVQFGDALVSSAIIWIKNRKPIDDQLVSFTYGGTIDNPDVQDDVHISYLEHKKKWTTIPLKSHQIPKNVPRLGDFFTIKRGIATGANDFFILPYSEIIKFNLPIEYFRPVLPSPRYLQQDEVFADDQGYPLLGNALFVLDCPLPMEQIKDLYPHLYTYLQQGVDQKIDQRYLCKHRKLWYMQEQRASSLFYCTYIGRIHDHEKQTFRFILNHSKAIVTNTYLVLYPKPVVATLLKKYPCMQKHIHQALNSISNEAMIAEGRVYGGGMYKLEPKELRNVPAIEIQNVLYTVSEHFSQEYVQLSLVS